MAHYGPHVAPPLNWTISPAFYIDEVLNKIHMLHQQMTLYFSSQTIQCMDLALQDEVKLVNVFLGTKKHIMFLD